MPFNCGMAGFVGSADQVHQAHPSTDQFSILSTRIGTLPVCHRDTAFVAVPVALEFVGLSTLAREGQSALVVAKVWAG